VDTAVRRATSRIADRAELCLLIKGLLNNTRAAEIACIALAAHRRQVLPQVSWDAGSRSRTARR